MGCWIDGFWFFGWDELYFGVVYEGFEINDGEVECLEYLVCL